MAEEQAKKTEDTPAVSNPAPQGTPKSTATEQKSKQNKKKGKKRTVPEAYVTIHASYNNTIVSVNEPNGNVMCWATAGSCGFKGTRKATPYAASVAADTAIKKAILFGVERVHISVKGVGTGRDQALRAVAASGVSIESIADKTALPHYGCRPRKARRN